MCGREVADEHGQQVGRDGGQQTDVQGAADALFGLVDEVGDTRGFRQNPPCPRDDLRPERGGGDGFAPAVEHLRPEFALQLGDHGAERRLRDAAHARRRGKTVGVGDRADVAELLEGQEDKC